MRTSIRSSFLGPWILISNHSVDWETETKMQEIIDEEFSAKTVVSVVHRLRFFDRYDRVAVMKNGELVECDRPQALLSVDSEFKKLHDAMGLS